jgi:hypothetical protein
MKLLSILLLSISFIFTGCSKTKIIPNEPLKLKQYYADTNLSITVLENNGTSVVLDRDEFFNFIEKVMILKFNYIKHYKQIEIYQSKGNQI